MCVHNHRYPLQAGNHSGPFLKQALHATHIEAYKVSSVSNRFRRMHPVAARVQQDPQLSPTP